MTTQLFKWKIFCTTDSQFEYIWQTSSPTSCPINGGHSVDTNRVSKEGDILCLNITDADSPYNYNQLGLLCDTTSGNITVNLPKASRSIDGVVFIKKTAASNTVTIDGYASELIDASATMSLTSLDEMAVLLCDGTGWTSQVQRYNVNDLKNMLCLPKSYTKGDLLIDDGNTIKSLSVGTNNYLISADSSQNEGIKWTNSLIDNIINIENSADSTKKVRFDLGSITTGNTRVITIPDATTTMVGTNTTQTLTNKTLTLPVISSISNSGTVTLPTGTQTLVGRTTTDTLTNKTLTLPVISSISNSGTITIPTGTDTLVGRITTDTLTNKTLSTGSTWSGNTIAVNKGGTGSTTLTQDGWLIGNGTGAITAIKNKMSATAAPSAATDDVSLGYAVGSRWFDTTADKEYVCLDNTDGAAVWSETTGNGNVVANANLTQYGLVVGDDGAKCIRTGTEWTLDANGVLGSGFSYAGYILDVHNTKVDGGGNGFRIMAGELLGDISFHVADADDTFQIMEMEADQGFITCGKTYAQTLTDNGVVYGIDLQHSGQATDFNTQNGIYRIGGNACMMGTQFQDASSDPESSTTSTTFIQKLRMTTGSLPSGKYRIGWSFETKNDSGSGGEYQVQINDTTTICTGNGIDSSTPGFVSEGGFYYASSISGVQNIDIDYRAIAGTMYIKEARLEIWRIS